MWPQSTNLKGKVPFNLRLPQDQNPHEFRRFRAGGRRGSSPSADRGVDWAEAADAFAVDDPEHHVVVWEIDGRRLRRVDDAGGVS